MAIKTGKIIARLDELAPGQLQESWDNSGLQLGDRQWTTDKILLALDVTLDVVQYASSNDFGFILSHHPLIFNKLARIDTSTPIGKIIALALEKRISIFSLHTNLDVVKGGVSDALANLLNLSKLDVLVKQKGSYYKLAVFVPMTHLEQVRKAMGDAGAGWIGRYSHCSFASVGKGRFLPGEGAKPWLGCENSMEEVDEYKLETMVEGFRVSKVLAAIKAAHPYEEVAYDLMPMANDAEYGLGRVGQLPEPMCLGDFSNLVGKVLGCPSLKVCGDDAQLIKKVAVCGGSGSNYVGSAHRSGADVMVTGDIGHHAALEAMQLGLALVDPGHYNSEYPILYSVESFLNRSFPDCLVARFPGSTDPLRIKTVNS